MSLTAIVGTVAKTLAGKLVSAGYGKITAKNVSEYESELYDIINATIKEFEKANPIAETEKIPFYSSQLLLESLLKFRLTREFNLKSVEEAFNSDDRIIRPSEKELQLFFEIFDNNIEKSKKIRDLNIGSNYKEEIFNIAEDLKRLAKQYNERVESEQKQFMMDKIPDVECHVFCQRIKPDSYDFTLGLFLEMTNHSTAIPVNKISVILSVETLGDCKGFATFFPTFNDLKPGEKQKFQAMHEYEKMIADSFPPQTVEFADLGDAGHPFYKNEQFEKYPAIVSIKFLPRFTGSAMVTRTDQLFFMCAMHAFVL